MGVKQQPVFFCPATPAAPPPIEPHGIKGQWGGGRGRWGLARSVFSTQQHFFWVAGGWIPSPPRGSLRKALVVVALLETTYRSFGGRIMPVPRPLVVPHRRRSGGLGILSDC